MVKVAVNSKVAAPFSSAEITKMIEKVAADLEMEEVLPQGVQLELSVALIDTESMLKLNQQYREVNSSTDVLSFCYHQTEREIVGELILAPETIEQYAKEDEADFETEFCKNIIHGILHIIGFEHSEKMFALQEKVLNSLLANLK